MALTLMIMALAFLAGVFLPLRWGAVGYLGVAALLFVVQVGVHTATGFDGAPIEETLILFNGSWPSFIGFNAQITYRAFALPLIALAVPLIWRLSRSRR
ncbi:MAG: hypothetical protein AAF218_01330 [Pseudomonadota bacterium]